MRRGTDVGKEKFENLADFYLRLKFFNEASAVAAETTEPSAE